MFFLPSRAGGVPSTVSFWKLLAYEDFLPACLVAFDVLWTLGKQEKELPFPEDIGWLKTKYKSRKSE